MDSLIRLSHILRTYVYRNSLAIQLAQAHCKDGSVPSTNSIILKQIIHLGCEVDEKGMM